MTVNDLTDEQKELLNQVSAGKNVLVDACIGSGKTTAIQVVTQRLVITGVHTSGVMVLKLP